MNFKVTPVFDMSKAVTITSKVDTDTKLIKDMSTANNEMHAEDTVTVTQ